MTSRMKKLFHRNKDSDAEQPPQRTQAPRSDRSDPALRSSRYESTEPGELPQTGDYPVKGNDSSVVLQQGRKSSISRSRRNSGTSHAHQSTTQNQYEAAKHTSHMTPPPNVAGRSETQQQSPPMPMNSQEDRRRRNLPQDFSSLDLAPTTTVTQTITTTRSPHPGYNTNRGTPPNQGSSLRSAAQDPAYYPSSHAALQHEDLTPQDNNTLQHQESTLPSDTIPQRREYASPNNPQLQESAPRNIALSSNREHVPRSRPGNRPVNEGDVQRIPMSQPYRGDLSSDPRSNVYNSSNIHDDDGADLARQNSIPRKQIGTSASTLHSYIPAASSPKAQTGQSRQQNTPKPLPSTPVAAGRGYVDRQTDSASQPPSILNRSRPIPASQTGLRDVQDVVDRAKTNTSDTQVIETVAPAVVHEKVHKTVHHIRDEVITREIHTHDVFHRIQPIVDVEVLPPRHFLPVEGGGLVEISASEVPGRGSNWVIAETASKIPSDQAAPPGTTKFTARNFPGREGDTVQYMSAEGYEKSERTWIHPPELEEGARITGQSWPMVIDEEPPGKSEHGVSGTHGFSSPKATKRKSPKNNPAIQASTAQRAGGETDKV